jgi:outer membrane protein assembly factor BamB
MRRSILNLCAAGVFAACSIVSVKAAAPIWTCAVQGEVIWQRTAAVGYLVACTKTGLCGIDVDKGAIIWTDKEFADISEDGISEIAGTPFFVATQKKETAIIDGFTGITVFSAKAEGFTSISNRYPMYRCAGLLVVGKKGETNAAVMTNMSDGKKRWELSGADYVFSAFEIDANSVLVVTALNVIRLDAATGKETWRKPNSSQAASLEGMGALGGLLKNMANKMAEKQQPINAMELHVKAESDAFFIAVEAKSIEESAGKKTETIKSSYSAFKLSDGSFLWPKGYSHNGKLGKLMLADEGVIIFNKDKINLLGYNDGLPAWGKKGKGLELNHDVQKVFKTDRGIICVTDNAVNILDHKTGTFQFEKDVKVISDIADVRVLPCGLLLCSDEECAILDLTTKKQLWPKPIKTAPGLYAVKDNKLYVYSTKEKKVLWADVSVAPAALTPLSSAEIEFQGKENPQKLEVRPNGILISSEQNLELLAQDGKSVFKAYFPAPRDPGIIRALNYANAVRAAYYGAAFGMASAQLTMDAEKSGKGGDKSLEGAFGQMYGQVSNAAMGAAGEAFKKASNGRYKATEQTQEHVFILTKTDKTCSLLQVSKNDGKVGETIDLGNDKKPVYSVDGVMGRLYYRPEPKKIVCYTF